MASTFNSPDSQNNDYGKLFAGDSQMAALMRAYDWGSHQLGNPEHWPLSLKAGLRIMLHSAHPMFIWWSEEMYMFHNDNYVPLMGNKHPEGLGSKGYEVWAETWPQLGGVLEGILQGNKAFHGQELLVPMNRKGFMEDAYWTFSYSPIFDDEGKVNGIFCACNEVTETVLAKRRLNTTKNIAESLVGLSSIEQSCQTTCEVIADNPHDIPFSLIYLLNETGTEARLTGQSADLPREIALPLEMISQSNSPAKWPFAEVQRSRQAEIVDLSGKKHLLKEFDTDLPAQAVVLPIFQPGSAGQGKDQLLGFFISGLNPGLEYDAAYQNFHQLLAGHITSSIASVKALEQKQMALQEAERQQKIMYDILMQTPAVICILKGPEHTFDLVNPVFHQLFGMRPLHGIPFRQALPELEGQPFFELLDNVYRTGEPFVGKEILAQLDRKNTGVTDEGYFNFIYQAMRDQNENINGILIFAYEVTEQVLARKKIEVSESRLQSTSDELAANNEEMAAANEEIQASNEELSESNQQLIRINSDLDNFIYTASHDLKAPITNIEGLLQALLRSLSPEMMAADRTRQITGMMQGSIDRFKKTITNLTEITKLQKENSQQATLVSVTDVIREAIQDLEPLIQSSNAHLETDMEDWSSIRFSQKNLRSIIYNLLSNALKYHSPERVPLVQVHCSQTDEYLVLTVRDNGLGMNLSDDSKIFSMFKRLHDHVEGTGIGLYMVKKIIDNAGGKIEVESKVGEGSVFRVYFKR